MLKFRQVITLKASHSQAVVYYPSLHCRFTVAI